jgi:hypothetical protein
MRNTVLILSAAAILAVAAARPSLARETSLFASEGNARDACGADHVVWVMLKGGKYYRAGSPGYDKNKDQQTGAYTCEKVARAEGGHVAPDGK